MAVIELVDPEARKIDKPKKVEKTKNLLIRNKC